MLGKIVSRNFDEKGCGKLCKILLKFDKLMISPKIGFGKLLFQQPSSFIAF